MKNNKNLHIAKMKADDEFYTFYKDIEKEIELYFLYDNNVFRNKTILLPCDDPNKSNFTSYFIKNFIRFGIKKLISTSFSGIDGKLDFFNNILFNGKIFILTKDNYSDNLTINNLKCEYLKGNGDFQSEEIVKYKKEADIIITNPPFSLFVNFFDWIIADKKDYLIIGSLIAATNKNIFRQLKNQTMYIGNYIGNMSFFKT